jgi:hypothetical protein
MTSARHRALLACCWLAVGAACDRNSPKPSPTLDASEESIATKTDVELLKRFINLPYAPTAVQWTTVEQPGRDDWSLYALIALTPDDTAALMKSAERLGGGRPSVQKRYFEQWFPAAVRFEVKAGSEDPYGHIPVEATRIEAAMFIAPEKSPAIHGQATVFEKQNLVFLGLFTM